MSAIPLWTLFVAGTIAIAITTIAFAVSLVIAQRRRLGLQSDYAARVARAHEEERARIARDLHDDALQRVALVRVELENLWSPIASSVSGESNHRMNAINTELLDLSVTLRALAQQLHPTVVEQLGLPRALESLASEFRRSGLDVGLHLPSEIATIRGQVAYAAYRIAQEGLRNVQKHAGTRSAELELLCGAHSLIVRVRDSGRGFNPNISTSRGLGIAGMRDRASALGGTLTLESHHSGGTIVEAVLPRMEGTWLAVD